MDKLLTIKEAKTRLGVTTKTIQRWDREGKIKVVRTLGGRRRIPESEVRRILGLREKRKVIGYLRVFSAARKYDLEKQAQLITEYARKMGYEVEFLQDVGSALNENRREFVKLLELVASGKVAAVIVAYREVLTRWGFDTLERLFSAFGTRLEVLDYVDKSPREELEEDFMKIVARFIGKIYGMRIYKYKEVVEGIKRLME